MDEESERLRNFQPHLWIIHELKKPPLGCICIVGLLGLENWKSIPLPADISNRLWSEQFKVVRDKIMGHQLQENVDRNIFGKVMGYLYRKTYNENFLFAVDGYLKEIFSPKLSNLDVKLKI